MGWARDQKSCPIGGADIGAGNRMVQHAPKSDWYGSSPLSSEPTVVIHSMGTSIRLTETEQREIPEQLDESLSDRCITTEAYPSKSKMWLEITDVIRFESPAPRFPGADGAHPSASPHNTHVFYGAEAA